MKESLSLSEYRRTHELTQIQLAAMLEVTPEYISMIEHGKKTPSKKLLNKLKSIPILDYGRSQKNLSWQSNGDGIIAESIRCHSCETKQIALDELRLQLERANAIIDALTINATSVKKGKA